MPVNSRETFKELVMRQDLGLMLTETEKLVLEFYRGEKMTGGEKALVDRWFAKRKETRKKKTRTLERVDL